MIQMKEEEGHEHQHQHHHHNHNHHNHDHPHPRHPHQKQQQQRTTTTTTTANTTTTNLESGEDGDRCLLVRFSSQPGLPPAVAAMYAPVSVPAIYPSQWNSGRYKPSPLLLPLLMISSSSALMEGVVWFVEI